MSISILIFGAGCLSIAIQSVMVQNEIEAGFGEVSGRDQEGFQETSGSRKGSRFGESLGNVFG
jgi:hypothetical protein